MTVQEKIDESRFFIDKIRNEYSKQRDVQYYFSAFLSSARSIGEHLLEEYNQKYGLGIAVTDRLDAEIFRNTANSQGNTNAQQFISWFDAQISQIRSDQVGSLWHMRNLNIHRATQKPNAIVVVVNENANNNTSNSSVRWQFQRIPNLDVLEVSERFLSLMNNLVTQAHTNFP